MLQVASQPLEVCSDPPVHGDELLLERARGGSYRSHSAEASNNSLKVAPLSPVVYSYGNLLALMYLKASFHKMLNILSALHTEGD